MNRQQRRAESKCKTGFDTALALHRAGKLAEAERQYRQIIAANPRHADALRLLGLILLGRGQAEEAATLIGVAASLCDDVALYHADLGCALRALGRVDAAAASFRRALARDPTLVEAHVNLGSLLEETGAAEAAVACFARAIELAPDLAEAHYNLGNALRSLGQTDAAIARYRQAIALRPDYAAAYANLGTVVFSRGQFEGAEKCFRAAIAADPGHAGAHDKLGAALMARGQAALAVPFLQKAIQLAPASIDPLCNLGAALTDLEQAEAALACHRRALALQPGNPEALTNLGRTLFFQRRFDEAIACYRAALAAKPDLASAHQNLSIALLMKGEWTEAWPHHEWRWETPEFATQRRNFSVPQWRGEPGGGRTLLIHAEQGFGDTLQFCRFASEAARRGFRVVMEVPRALVRIVATVPGVAAVVAKGDVPEKFDLHCPMLSLPLACAATPETVPCPLTYMSADAAAVQAWRARLGLLARGGPRVGLTWAASQAVTASRSRSIDPSQVRPLLDVEGVAFVSLQKDGPSLPASAGLIDLMGEMTDFADTAALVATLDLVIAVDTAIVHLAGALGKPVWLLARFDHDWRWLEGRRDSPWYKALRIYHQPRPGAWDAVIAEVVADLRDFADARAERLQAEMVAGA